MGQLTVRFLIVILLCLMLLPAATTAQPVTLVDATGTEVTIDSLEAIVSGSGDVSEIIAALGFTDNLVGVDETSTYPPELLETIPSVGFARLLSVEPILAQAPTLFFCTQTCSPDSAFQQLREAGVPVVIVPDNETDGLALPRMKIEMVAEALGVPEAGQGLAERVEREIDWVNTALANVESSPLVFHFYIRGRGLQLAAGTGTPAHFMIEGAGGVNTAVDAGVEGYEPLTPELIFSAFPEYLILTSGNVEASGGLEAILDVQGLGDTPAVQNDNVIVVDTQLLLGLSIRTGESLMFIASETHPDMTWEVTQPLPYTVADSVGNEWTVDAERRIVASNPEIQSITQNLGFHAVLLADVELTANDLILATESDDWQTWIDEQGLSVYVLPATYTVQEIGLALNVQGRVQAYQARFTE